MSKPYETFEVFGLPLAFENTGAMYCQGAASCQRHPIWGMCDLCTLSVWPERGVKGSSGETQ